MYSSWSAALPTERSSCNFLEPIKKDLIENFFENECGDAVSLLSSYSSYYEHLTKDDKGSWCPTSRFPRCHRIFSGIRVITFTHSIISSLIPGGKNSPEAEELTGRSSFSIKQSYRTPATLESMIFLARLALSSSITPMP